jgi:23S rRNA (uracil1939-C5)-methyltransferase
MHRTYPTHIFRRVFGLFWPLFDFKAWGAIYRRRYCPPSLESKIGSKEPKNRLKLISGIGSKPKETLEISIQKFSKKGYGVALIGPGKEIEVAHCVPGDTVRVEWRKKRSRLLKGRLLEVVASSADRIPPRCAHATVCGGCTWQQVTYSAQLKEKMRRIERAFDGKFPVDPILPATCPFGYRNKMEFTFSQNGTGAHFLGLGIAQASPYVFNVTECHLCPPWFAAAASSVREWWQRCSLSAYYPPKDSGTLRYLTLREAMRTGQKMAILNVSGHPDFAPSRENLEGFVESIRQVAPEAAIFLRIHQAKLGHKTRVFEMLLSGPDHIVEELHLKQGLLHFKISPSSFFQPNTFQAEKLYDAALSLLGGPSIVYDLYCGGGALGMAAAKSAKQVVGIELSPEAVLDANENLKTNRIGNMTIHQGDAGQTIAQLIEAPAFIRPDAVLVDPPRAGLDAQAIHHLKNLFPKTIVYISCNPVTQASNIGELIQAGYRVKRLQPVDQFPHTPHIENIALLEK